MTSPSSRPVSPCGARPVVLLVLLGLLAGCGGDAAPTGSGSGSGDGPAVGADRPHLILISIDTLRADHLGCYGHEHDTSPTLDALARESWFFEQLMATSSSTGPCHMSMLSGLLPRVHGIFNERPALPSGGVPYVPQLLQRAGWRTAAFADGGIVTEAYGFQRGFEQFDSRWERFDAKLDRVEDWLGAAPDEPTFLFVHTYGVHTPYLPAPEHDLFTDPAYDGPLAALVADLRGRMAAPESHDDLARMQGEFLAGRHDYTEADRAYLMGLYDGCIHEVDAGIERLLALLDAKGWLDDAWLVLTSDHGEAFGEHGSYSHRQLHREELWVPLMIRPPGGMDGRRVATRVSQLDMAPTLLELLEQPLPPQMQGRSLLPFEGLTQDRRALANGGALRRDAVFDGPYKLIHTLGRERELLTALYDVVRDGAETRDLSEEAGTEVLAPLTELLIGMQRECGQLVERVGEPMIIDLDDIPPELREELEGLGYFGR